MVQDIHILLQSAQRIEKRFCNKDFCFNPWQGRFHDHIIRNREDYEQISRYIYENPINWETDEFY